MESVAATSGARDGQRATGIQVDPDEHQRATRVIQDVFQVGGDLVVALVAFPQVLRLIQDEQLGAADAGDGGEPFQKLRSGLPGTRRFAVEGQDVLHIRLQPRVGEERGVADGNEQVLLVERARVRLPDRDLVPSGVPDRDRCLPVSRAPGQRDPLPSTIIRVRTDGEMVDLLPRGNELFVFHQCQGAVERGAGVVVLAAFTVTETVELLRGEAAGPRVGAVDERTPPTQRGDPLAELLRFGAELGRDRPVRRFRELKERHNCPLSTFSPCRIDCTDKVRHRSGSRLAGTSTWILGDDSWQGLLGAPLKQSTGDSGATGPAAGAALTSA